MSEEDKSLISNVSQKDNTITEENIDDNDKDIMQQVTSGKINDNITGKHSDQIIADKLNERVNISGKDIKSQLVQETKCDENDESEHNISEESEESQDGDDSDDNDEDDEDDDVPPRLIYQRLNGLPPNLFNRDPISACHFHEAVFIFATHSGIIHITRPDFSPVRTFKGHRASILSIYTDGNYFATGSMDGTVVIGSISDDKDIIAYDFKRPIHAVVLDKNYSKSRSFYSGGMSGRILHSSKNWLGQRKDVMIEENNGPIVCIQMIDDLIIWMNDKGITVYHTTRKQTILTINKPQDSPRSDVYWPRVHFPEINRVIIAWANHIWSLRISIRSSNDVSEPSSSSRSRIIPSSASMSFRNIQEKIVKVEHVFKLDDLVCGVSFFRDDLLMILTYSSPSRNENTNKLEFNNPDLKLINSTTGQVEFEEEIGLRNIDGLGLNDFTLGSHIDVNKTRYFIMSAKDGVIAQELQLQDRLNWFIEREKYLEAWEISKNLSLPRTKVLNIGILHADNLIKLGNWGEAASFLSSLLYLNIDDMPDGDTKSTVQTSFTHKLNEEYEGLVKEIISQWENWSNIFIKSHHIEHLTDIIPRSPKLNINPSIYTQILQYWINHIKDSNKFFELIDEWSTEVYDARYLESYIEGILEKEQNDKLRKCLTSLYVRTFKFKKAVPHLITLKDPNIIPFLSTNHILDTFANQFPIFISLRFKDNELKTLPIDKLRNILNDIVDIFVENRHEIPSEKIIKMMSENHLDFINYFYLEKLADIDSFLARPFSNERIELYAKYDSKKLLPFLSKSSSYDIDKAIELCESHQFTEELVYLLGKIGENKKAITLIINELDDPEKAIKFAKHQNDKEVWNMLLNYSLKKPAFIKALIECADEQSNSYYDPVSILEGMPDDIEVHGLEKSVTKILNNNDLNLLLNKFILSILYGQSEDISSFYRLERLKGIEVEINSPIERLILRFETLLVSKDAKGVQLISEAEYFEGNRGVIFKKPYTTFDEKLKHIAYIVEYLSQNP